MAESVAAAVATAIKPNVTRLIVNHVATCFELIHNNGKAYAVYRGKATNGAGELYGPDEPPGIARPFGASLRRYIVGAAWAGGKTIGRSVVDNAMAVLEAMAYKGPATPLALRFYHDPDARRVVVDLGRDDGFCVVITAEGWTLDHPPKGVIFRRSHATRPLPVPTDGGTLAELAPALGFDHNDAAFKLMLGWVLGLPFEASVRPGLLLTGDPGVGKTTRLRLLTSLWEPSKLDDLGGCFGQNHADDLVRASYRAVPLWDNLSGVSNATSDLLCTIITGSGREVRQLYTTGDLDTTAIQRPVGLTGVTTPAGLRADALDRLVVVDAPAPEHRIDDAEVQRRFDELHPRLLGAACHAVVAVLAQPANLWPGDFRMAAYAKVLASVDMASGPLSLGLLDAYATAVREAKERNAADDVFGGAVIRLLTQRGGQWSGSAGELRYQAGGFASTPADLSGPGWPRSDRGVPEVLSHLRSGLALLGVTWTKTKSQGLSRYHLTARPIEDV